MLIWNLLIGSKKVAIGAEQQKLPTMNPYRKEKIYKQQFNNNQFANQRSDGLVNNVPVWDNPLNLPPQGNQQQYQFIPIVVPEAFQRLIQLPNNTPVHNSSLQIPCNPQQNKTPRWKSRNSKRWYNNRSSDNELTPNITKPDLREKLVRRKSISESFNGNEEDRTKKWKENDQKEKVWEETSVQMSLRPLKLLTYAGCTSDQWHIVVDADVILKNYNYLNNMAAADPNCHLLVPFHVMSELQVHVSESSNVQARRVLRFLTQQIESGLAILGEEVDGESACHMTLNTCLMLASQYTHVVLITNNTELFHYKTNIENLYAFTMQQIKDILENKPKRIKLFRGNSPTLALKIVVPNTAMETNIASRDDIFSTPSPRLDSTRSVEPANYTRDVANTLLQTTCVSTELANNYQDTISERTSQRFFDSAENASFSENTRIFDETELDSDAREMSGMSSRRIVDATGYAYDTENDVSGMNSQTMVDTRGYANDTKDTPGTISQKMVEASEFVNNDTEHMSGLISQRIICTTGYANDTEDMSDSDTEDISQKMVESIEYANDTEDISRKMVEATKKDDDSEVVSGLISQRMVEATENANETEDMSEIISRRMVESTEYSNDARDVSEITFHTHTATEYTSDTEAMSASITEDMSDSDSKDMSDSDTENMSDSNTEDISRRMVEATENTNDSEDMSGMISRKIIEETEYASNTEDMSGLFSQKINDATECPHNISGKTSQKSTDAERAHDARYISATNSRKSSFSTEVDIDAKDISGTTSRRNNNATKNADARKISEANSRESSISTKLAMDAKDISGTTSRRNVEATELAKGARDTCETNSRNTSISTKVVMGAKDIAGTTSRKNVDATERAKNVREIFETNSRKASISTKVAMDAKDISGKTSRRNIKATECTENAREISETNSRKSFVSTEVATNAKDISGMTSRKNVDATERAKNVREIFETNSRKASISTKVAMDAKDISGKTSRRNIKATECTENALEISETNSRKSFVSTEVATNAKDISGMTSRINVDATERPKDVRNICEINPPKASISTKVAIDFKDISGTISRRNIKATKRVKNAISETDSLKSSISTEVAMDAKDISATPSRRNIKATERAKGANDISEINSRKSSVSTKGAKDYSGTTSRRNVDATERAKNAKDICETNSREASIFTKVAIDAKDISGKTSRIIEATERAKIARDISDIHSRKSDVSTKVATGAKDICAKTSRKNIEATERVKIARDISETNSRQASISTKVDIDAKDISGTTSRRNVDAPELANDTRDISEINLQKCSISTKVAMDAKNISGTTPRRNVDAPERAKKARDISEIHSRKSSVSTKVDIDAKDISGTTSRRNVDAPELAKDARDISEINLQNCSSSTKVAMDAKDISGTTHRRNVDAPERAKNARDISEIHSRKSSVSTKVDIDAKDISGTTSRRNVVAPERAKDARDISEIHSRKSSVSTKVATGAKDICGITTQRNVEATERSNDASVTLEKTSRIIHHSPELHNDASTKISKHNLNQNLSIIPAKELAGTNVSTKSQFKVQPGELFNPDWCRSPSKSVPKRGTQLADADFQSPAKMSDHSSPQSSSSSASDHVSLDSVCIRQIISMKNLTGTKDKELVRKRPAKRISPSKITNVLTQATHKPSVSRSASHSNNSDPIGVERNLGENMIVEKTPSSDRPKNHNQDLKKKIPPEKVIFEVAGQSMENVLRTRFDEWMFRFKQIMEDVITVKSQERKKAPTLIPEALASIMQKYNMHHLDFTAAAKHHTNTIFKMGDVRGKSTYDMEPSEFMDMYSNGVYLVDTFQDTCAACMNGSKKEKTSGSTEGNSDACTCYYVKTASESLKKLLYDIQNDKEETFLDNPHRKSTDNLNSDSDQHYYEFETYENYNMEVSEVKSTDSSNEPETTQSDENNASCSPYNLRPKRRKSQNATNSYNVRPQRRKSISNANPRRKCMQKTEEDTSSKGENTGKDIEVTYFNCLHLQRKSQDSVSKNDETPMAVEEKACDATDQAQTTEGSVRLSHQSDLNLHNIKIHFNKGEKSSRNVVRHFTVNPDFEKKIKERKNENEYEDNGDNLKQCETENNINIHSESSNESRFLGILVIKLKRFFTKISTLCKEYTLSEEKSDERFELHRELEQWLEHIVVIQSAFDRAIKQEHMNKDQQMLLKSIANVNYVPDDKLFFEHREKIYVLKDTADEFHNLIKRLLNFGQGTS